jgi:TRAP transporter TAXI family solute receptor
MERSQVEQIAVGAGPGASVGATATGRLPRWLRVVSVVGIVAIAGGVGLFAYRTYSAPTTLTIAVGSLDAETNKVMSAIATRMASANAPVRLKVLDKGTAPEAAAAFAAGQADLAVVRADTRNIPQARTVVLVTHAVALLIALPGSSINDIDGLKGKTVGVVGSAVNQDVVAALIREYDLERAKVNFKDIPLQELPHAIKARQMQALLVVAPISEKYLGLLRGLWPRNAKLALIAIESAGAIAAVNPAYESYEVPKGTIRGSPAIPGDDLTTLRVPLYLVANRKVDDDIVSALAKAVMESRRELVGEFPVLSQIASPSTDKDAFIPIHAGAAAYFDGDQKTFFDKYGDQFFYGSMLLGTLTSIFAAAWKFMTKDSNHPAEHPLRQLHGLTEQIIKAGSDTELDAVERSIDDVLKAELERPAGQDGDANETAALSLMIHRLEHLVEQRRAALHAAAPQAS